MAAPAIPKKKSANHPDGLPRNGLTGMGFSTQKHFIEVKQKMINYVEQQEVYEYDGGYPNHRHSPHHVDPIVVDGKRASKERSQPHTPTSSRKQVIHLGLPRSPAVRRAGGKSPTTRAK